MHFLNLKNGLMNVCVAMKKDIILLYQITVEGSLEVYFIKKYFKPLPLNEDGLCAHCEKLLKK